jgi:hypothetical protein
VEGVVEMFRTIPPLDVVEQVFRSLKFTGVSDKRWFSKDDLPMESLEEWLPTVEPYYLPCKAQRYLHRDVTQNGVITILRHLLKVHSIELKTQEKMINGRKTTLYQVFYEHVDPVVRFD